MRRDDAGPGPDAGATLLVVRHAHAGDRDLWQGPDERRPLTRKGRQQAAGLVDLLADLEVGRILCSRYVRCLETVVPLACDRRLSIEVHPALAEGASVGDAGALVAGVAGTATVLCTHGDVVWNLLVGLAHHAAGASDDLPMSKGSTWVAVAQDGRVTPVRYLPPPPAPA